MNESIAVCSGGDCLILALVALSPSALWLLFFVFQDRHREKAHNVASIFLWGVAVAFPVVIIETTAQDAFAPFLAAVGFLAIAPIFYNFVGVAFVEEIAKYFVVRFKALGKPFLDEPQDAMLYMIIAGLGFASIENLTYAFNPDVPFGFDFRLQIALIRGITSTVLHVVASGSLGYFLALSIINKKERGKFLFTGLAIATLLHGIYNHFIIRLDIKLGEITQRTELGLLVPEADMLAVRLETLLIASFLILSGIIVLVTFRVLGRKNFK